MDVFKLQQSLIDDYASYITSFIHIVDLPTQAQKLVESCQTRLDFWYQEGGKKAAIYIDRPFHQYPERQKRDQEQEECLEDIGIRVIRFKHTDQWNEIVAKYPDVFGP